MSNYGGIVIKLSGESISALDGGIDIYRASGTAKKIVSILDLCDNVSVVVGGGNIIRGRDFSRKNHANLCDATAFRKTTADSIGMISTILNALYLLEILISDYGVSCDVFTPKPISYGTVSTKDYSQYGSCCSRLSFFAGGTGLPYFSTDICAVICAKYTGSGLILKATKTDGVYDKDPLVYQDAVHISEITYSDAIAKNIKIMDQAAFFMARDSKIKIKVFNMNEDDCFRAVIEGKLKHSTIL